MSILQDRLNYNIVVMEGARRETAGTKHEAECNRMCDQLITMNRELEDAIANMAKYKERYK